MSYIKVNDNADIYQISVTKLITKNIKLEHSSANLQNTTASENAYTLGKD